MVPASLYLGFTASIIWVGQVTASLFKFSVPGSLLLSISHLYTALQGTYLTSAALSHAREHNLPEGPTLGSFNGEFWGMFASTQVQLSKSSA